jgi:hypothetical protein
VRCNEAEYQCKLRFEIAVRLFIGFVGHIMVPFISCQLILVPSSATKRGTFLLLIFVLKLRHTSAKLTFENNDESSGARANKGLSS